MADQWGFDKNFDSGRLLPGPLPPSEFCHAYGANLAASARSQGREDIVLLSPQTGWFYGSPLLSAGLDVSRLPTLVGQRTGVYWVVLSFADRHPLLARYNSSQRGIPV